MKFDHLPIFDNISFSTREKEFVVIKGKNGAGKTCLLQSIAGIIPKYIYGELTGNISYYDRELYTSREKKAFYPQIFGYLMQEPDKQLCFPFIEEELFFGAENLQRDYLSVKERYEGLCELFPFLSPNSKTLETHKLSFGQKKICLFASQILKDPDIFLLDEPSVGLSSDLLSKMEKILYQLQNAGKIVIFAEHQDYFDKFASQIVRL